jgi:ABC-type Na+ transport system ATPase subunit NatA
MTAFKNLITRIIKSLLRGGVSFVNHHPKLRLYTVAIVRKVGLSTTARSAYRRLTGARNRKYPNRFIPKDLKHLSPRSRQIYIKLKAALEYHQQENR